MYSNHTSWSLISPPRFMASWKIVILFIELQRKSESIRGKARKPFSYLLTHCRGALNSKESFFLLVWWVFVFRCAFEMGAYYLMLEEKLLCLISGFSSTSKIRKGLNAHANFTLVKVWYGILRHASTYKEATAGLATKRSTVGS